MGEYVTIIKDISTIIFTCVGTILGILTYKRAKATILQPVRTEVVKKQSVLLSELLSVITKDEVFAFDYIGIVGVNVYLILMEYGYVFSNQEKLKEMINSKRYAIIPCGEDIVLGNLKLFQPFDDKPDREKDKKEWVELSREKYNKAKKDGIIIIDEIVITSEHYKYFEKLRDFETNPFIPSIIQESIKDILNTVNLNLKVYLRQTLTDFTTEFVKRGLSEKKFNFSIEGIYNEFNHKRLHHHEQFEKIKKAIRSHLRIEERWC
jgi:hypothetical protein